MTITSLMLKRLISNYSTGVVNAEINSDDILLKDWVNKITLRLSGRSSHYQLDDYNPSAEIQEGGCDFMLLSREGSNYKVANYHGIIWDPTFTEIKILTELERIANCSTGELKMNGYTGII